MANLSPKRMQYIALALALPFATCGVQWLFWSTFKPFVWFLFYPTVYFSSRIGGKWVGQISTVVSALLVVYVFIPPQLSLTGKPLNNLLSVVVFLIMGWLFSYTHERLERSQRRETDAREATRIVEEQLQEARIGRLEAEQRLATEKLRDSENLLKVMGRSAQVGGWELDPLTGKGAWTEEVARIHDLPPDAQPDRERWLTFYRGESRARIEDAIREVIETGTAYDLELEMSSAKGAHKWIRTICQPLLEDGKVVKLQGSFQDITERKRAEMELRQRNEELERFNHASVGRELEMIQLKRQINTLSQRLGKPSPYDLSFSKGFDLDGADLS